MTPSAPALYSDNLSPAPTLDPNQVNILVVDDLPEKLLAYEAILQELGQNMVMARSGEEALRLVLQKEFAVILLDVNMPGMDGFETAALIRKRKKSAHTPIIFLTAFTDEVRMAQGYASGAVDYLPTPVVPEILQAKVKVFIELSQMRQMAALRAEERAMRTAAEESAQRSEFLVQASGRLASPTNVEEMLQALAAIPIPYLGDLCMVWLAPTEGEAGKLVWSWKATEGEISTQSVVPAVLPTGLADATQSVISTGQYKRLKQLVLAQYLIAEEVPFDLPHLDAALLLPLTLQGRVRGILFIAHTEKGHRYQPNDITLGMDLADRASVALEKATLMQRIQEADHRKDEFLAMLAHELRNPLAPISNALQLMKLAPAASPVRLDAQATIERQLKHLIHLVDDLMDVSRITQGKIELRKEPIILQDTLCHAIEISDPLIQSRRHELRVDMPEEPIWLNADTARIAQVFANLLNNAAKYTNEGGKIELQVQAPARGSVEIHVRDNGIGIPSAMVPFIFDLFTQVDSSMERTQGGLGIGLTLVKSLIEMHQGTISVSSIGTGSDFTVTFPVQKAAALPQKSESAPIATTAPLKVLIVDDNEASAQTLGWMLDIIGHEKQLAFDGPSAIELAKTYQPDVILLDIGLPGMNGYETCKAMRVLPNLKQTLFIAQTGWDQKEHRNRSKEAGFDHHLVKPIELNTLQELLASKAAAV